jgi:hypothetical protein
MTHAHPMHPPRRRVLLFVSLHDARRASRFPIAILLHSAR